jgi:hypothetical protein
LPAALRPLRKRGSGPMPFDRQRRPAPSMLAPQPIPRNPRGALTETHSAPATPRERPRG